MLGRSTPILSLEAESGIPPLNLHRTYLDVKKIIRLRNKHESFETSRMMNLNESRMSPELFPFKSFSWRSTRSINRLNMPEMKRVFTTRLSLPPWQSLDNLVKFDFLTAVHSNTDFNSYTDQHFDGYTKIFTDGSKITDNDQISTSSALYSPQHKISICWKLRPEHSVFSAELYGIWRALLFCKERNIKKAVIFTDSKSSLQAILNGSDSCLLYTSPSPRDKRQSRMPSSA